ncbi:hypothetical protein A4A49_04112 [Nicotiana attenuata]|uniref:Uncharacterized protein n=1 Tax=Nicotiana attenuata TaxID=49451 RepID=A0A1J6I629_NICAT|nr:hypothetical protein A4A49_04112 [Nicotiana attenuata]
MYVLQLETLEKRSSMEDETLKLKALIDASVKEVTDSFSKDIAEIRNHKLSFASLYLDGEALDWYCWLCRNKQLADWDHFVEKLFIHYRTRSREAHDSRLAFLQKLTTMDYCPTRAAAIPPWSAMAKSPSPQFWNLHSDCNNLNSAHKVLEKQSDRETSVVDDKTTIPTADATKLEVEDEDAAVQVTIDEGTKVLLTQAKEKMDNSDLDDNDEDFRPPVIAVGEENIQRDEAGQRCQPKSIKSSQNTVIASFSISKQLQLTDASANILVNKVRKLFDICSQKAGKSLIDNEVVDEQSDTLILDGTRLIHKHIFIHFPFDPGVPLSIKFEYLDMHLDTLHWLPLALYSGVFGLDELAAHHRLPHGLSDALVYVILLNKCVIVGKVMTELNVIRLNLFTVNQIEHGCNWLIAVTMARFDGERATKTVHQCFMVDNFSFGGSEHVKEYGNDSTGTTKDLILASLSIMKANTIILPLSSRIDIEERWSKNGITDTASCELLLKSIANVPHIAEKVPGTTNSAAKLRHMTYRSLSDTIRCFALLDTSKIVTLLCHVIWNTFIVLLKLSNKDEPRSKLQATNQIMILFLKVFAYRSPCVYNILNYPTSFSCLNLEDKVLFEGGSIVVNQVDSIGAHRLEEMNDVQFHVN